MGRLKITNSQVTKWTDNKIDGRSEPFPDDTAYVDEDLIPAASIYTGDYNANITYGNDGLWNSQKCWWYGNPRGGLLDQFYFDR